MNREEPVQASTGTAMVIGARGFGRYHAKILANHHLTKELVVTATSERSLQEVMDFLESEKREELNIVDCVARTPQDYAGIAGAYKPRITSVCTPDAFHIDAINAVAPHSKFVLCEKPIGSAWEAPVMDRLEIPPNKLSINLPAYIITRGLLAQESTRDIRNANGLDVYWTLGYNNAPAIDNILPHAWSVLAPLGKVGLETVAKSNGLLSLRGRVLGQNRFIPYQMHIGYEEKPSRELRTADSRYVFDGAKVLHNNVTVFDAGNPLQQQIIGALRGKPLAGYYEAKECQEFIELAYELL